MSGSDRKFCAKGTRVGRVPMCRTSKRGRRPASTCVARDMVAQMFAFPDLGFHSLLTPLLGGAVCMALVKLAAVACERATLARDRELTARAERETAAKKP